MQKLMVSKQIMDRHNQMPRGQASSGGFNSQLSEGIPPVMNYNETPIPATYNIPEEFLQPTQSVQPKQVPVTEDRIKNSKLPDAIKKLMIEHPIQQPQSYQPTISNEVIEKAARLMGENKQITQTSQNSKQPQASYGLSASILKKLLEKLLRKFCLKMV